MTLLHDRVHVVPAEPADQSSRPALLLEAARRAGRYLEGVEGAPGVPRAGGPGQPVSV